MASNRERLQPCPRVNRLIRSQEISDDAINNFGNDVIVISKFIDDGKDHIEKNLLVIGNKLAKERKDKELESIQELQYRYYRTKRLLKIQRRQRMLLNSGLKHNVSSYSTILEQDVIDDDYNLESECIQEKENKQLTQHVLTRPEHFKRRNPNYIHESNKNSYQLSIWDGSDFKLSLLISLRQKLILKMIFQSLRYNAVNIITRRTMASSFTNIKHKKILQLCFYAILFEAYSGRYIYYCSMRKIDSYLSRKLVSPAMQQFHYYRRNSLRFQLANHRSIRFYKHRKFEIAFNQLYTNTIVIIKRRLMRKWSYRHVVFMRAHRAMKSWRLAFVKRFLLKMTLATTESQRNFNFYELKASCIHTLLHCQRESYTQYHNLLAGKTVTDILDYTKYIPLPDVRVKHKYFSGFAPASQKSVSQPWSERAGDAERFTIQSADRNNHILKSNSIFFRSINSDSTLLPQASQGLNHTIVNEDKATNMHISDTPINITRSVSPNLGSSLKMRNNQYLQESSVSHRARKYTSSPIPAQQRRIKSSSPTSLSRGKSSSPTSLSRGKSSSPTSLSRGKSSSPTPLSRGKSSSPTSLSRGKSSSPTSLSRVKSSPSVLPSKSTGTNAQMSSNVYSNDSLDFGSGNFNDVFKSAIVFKHREAARVIATNETANRQKLTEALSLSTDFSVTEDYSTHNYTDNYHSRLLPSSNVSPAIIDFAIKINSISHVNNATFEEELYSVGQLLRRCSRFISRLKKTRQISLAYRKVRRLARMNTATLAFKKMVWLHLKVLQKYVLCDKIYHRKATRAFLMSWKRNTYDRCLAIQERIYLRSMVYDAFRVIRNWEFQYRLRVLERDGYNTYVVNAKRKAMKRWRRNLIILSKLHLLAIKKCKPLIVQWRKKIANIRCIRKVFVIYEAAWNHRIDNNIWNSPSMNMSAIIKAWSHFAYMEKRNRIEEQNNHKALVFRATSLLATHFVLWNTEVTAIKRHKAILREEERQQALILQERVKKEELLIKMIHFFELVKYTVAMRHQKVNYRATHNKRRLRTSFNKLVAYSNRVDDKNLIYYKKLFIRNKFFWRWRDAYLHKKLLHADAAHSSTHAVGSLFTRMQSNVVLKSFKIWHRLYALAVKGKRFMLITSTCLLKHKLRYMFLRWPGRLEAIKAESMRQRLLRRGRGRSRLIDVPPKVIVKSSAKSFIAPVITRLTIFQRITRLAETLLAPKAKSFNELLHLVITVFNAWVDIAHTVRSMRIKVRYINSRSAHNLLYRALRHWVASTAYTAYRINTWVQKRDIALPQYSTVLYSQQLPSTRDRLGHVRFKEIEEQSDEE